MKFYNRYYKNNFDELITYYPLFYRDVREMIAILKAYGRACDEIEGHVEQAYLNNFILEADEPTIKKWEDTLEIVYDKKLTLDQRKSVVIGRMSGYGHIGEPEIRVIISLYTDCDITVDFKKGVVIVDIDGEIFDEGNLYETLVGRLPAHLALKMTARTIRTFRSGITFGFGGGTGAELSAEPISTDRESVLELSSGTGGLLVTRAEGSPPTTVNRDLSIELSAGAGSLFIAQTKGSLPATKRRISARAGGQTGNYLYTITNSKLIKEED